MSLGVPHPISSHSQRRHICEAGKAAGKGKSLLLQDEDSSAFLSGAGFTLERERANVPLANALQMQTEGAVLQCLCSLQPDKSGWFCKSHFGRKALSTEVELCESPASISYSLPLS